MRGKGTPTNKNTFKFESVFKDSVYTTYAEIARIEHMVQGGSVCFIFQFFLRSLLLIFSPLLVQRDSWDSLAGVPR